MLISIHQERNSIWSRSVRFDLSVSRKRLSNPSKMLFFDTGRGQYFPIVGHLYSNFFPGCWQRARLKAPPFDSVIDSHGPGYFNCIFFCCRNLFRQKFTWCTPVSSLFKCQVRSSKQLWIFEETLEPIRRQGVKSLNNKVIFGGKINFSFSRN